MEAGDGRFELEKDDVRLFKTSAKGVCFGSVEG